MADFTNTILNGIKRRQRDMGDGTFAEVVATAPPGAMAATSTPLAGSVADTAAHTFGPFKPQLVREIWATLVGTGATGKAQLVRSTDGGVTMAGLTAGAMLGQAGPSLPSRAPSSMNRSAPRQTRRPPITSR